MDEFGFTNRQETLTCLPGPGFFGFQRLHSTGIIRKQTLKMFGDLVALNDQTDPNVGRFSMYPGTLSRINETWKPKVNRIDRRPG